MSDEKRDVDAAYALKTPEDNLKLYAGWAETYDQDFAARMNFLMPDHVAQLFCELGGRGPVLDAGAGTGLAGQALAKRSGVIIDAIDLSPEMLGVAETKGVYRDLIVANLLKPLPLKEGAYNGVVSSGTFTHGHVGPDALDHLMRVAGSGAIFVLTIKQEHYEEHGFAEKFEGFGDRIREFRTVTRAIYGAGEAGEHIDDQGLIVSFRKA